MKDGFFRVAAAVPKVEVADVAYNTASIIEMIDTVSKDNVDLIVFPELSLTGYTCGDLFHNESLLSSVENAVHKIIEATKKPDSPLVFVGAPLVVDGVLYNCALAIKGALHAIVPKTYLPNYNEFYEKRWWNPAPDALSFWVDKNGASVPFGTDIILSVGGVKIGAEICEDLWTPIPPSSKAAIAGAQIIVNLSASDDLVGKYKYLSNLIAGQSARCLCGYVYSSAGYGESSTDLVFDGKAIVAECGRLLSEGKRWNHEAQYVVSDIDIQAIDRDRLHVGSFADCKRRNNAGIADYKVVDCGEVKNFCSDDTILRETEPHPFVPDSDVILADRCEEIINIQTAALCRRLEFTHCRHLVIGISGGLDSTLALLVAVRAFDKLGLDRKGICGVTMPGFGTTGRTHGNAVALMNALGVDVKEISIVPSVLQHFSDIGHDVSVMDVTYENCQARERTQILMDVANELGGMVLGTGDLSELALGWATYNGDHMSMYGINAGVPKTLVRHLVKYFALNIVEDDCRDTLLDIIDTPISPELIPAASDGSIAQKTEDLVGPYELHDFFIYYVLRYGYSPKRIYMLALNSFTGVYDSDVIKHWLKVFFKRFFTQQFKRSCLPDGPKVGSVCLSPRGDWRMPSDASAALWLRECDEL